MIAMCSRLKASLMSFSNGPQCHQLNAAIQMFLHLHRCFFAAANCMLGRAADQRPLLLNMNVAQDTEHHMYSCSVLWLVQQNTKSLGVFRIQKCAHQQ